MPRENIVGTPLMIYWSFEAPTADLTNPNIGIDHIVDVIAHFFTKTRWTRTFKLIRGYPLKYGSARVRYYRAEMKLSVRMQECGRITYHRRTFPSIL